MDVNEHLQEGQDAAWSLKDLCDDLAPRKLGERDVATLQSVLRDLGRLEQKLVGIRDKRKRDKGDEPEPQSNGSRSTAPAPPGPHTPRIPLFELVARTLDVLAEIDLADGEVSAAADDVLRELGVSLEERAEAYAAVCRLPGEEAEACDRYVET